MPNIIYYSRLKIAMQPKKLDFLAKNGVLKRLQPKVKKIN